MSAPGPAIVQPQEGKRICIFGGIEFTVKIANEQSGGLYSLLDVMHPPGTYLPPHVHHREDETFYILEGEFEIHVGEETIRALPGATFFGPRGIPHSFRVSDAGPGRMLLLTTPGGFERCMEELSALGGEPDPPAIFAVAARYGIEFLPPPNNDLGG